MHESSEVQQSAGGSYGWVQCRRRMGFYSKVSVAAGTWYAALDHPMLEALPAHNVVVMMQP